LGVGLQAIFVALLENRMLRSLYRTYEIVTILRLPE
jgi:hypothetical protein